MKRAEFDRFADEYHAMHSANISASGENPEYFADYKMRDFAEQMSRLGLYRDTEWFLDFGAGTGNSVPYFVKHLPRAQLCEVDVSVRSLDIGRMRFGRHASFITFDGETLPFADGVFAGAFACCVFHHIPGDLHVHLLAEIRRVVAPGGAVMIYEHNPWNPLTVRAVNTCPFDDNAVLINAATMVRRLKEAGFSDVRKSYRVFFPHALRALRPIEQMLRWNPLGAQYFALAVR